MVVSGTRRALAGLAAVVAVAVAGLALVVCTNEADEPAAVAQPTPTPTPEPMCPLSGLDVPPGVDLGRPAVAVKVENNVDAYPLAGLEKAEIVYEEQVEGGQTRFMAIYHCTDAAKVGSVRSSREVDPAIMTPTTRILAAAGGNEIVRSFLTERGIVLIDEDVAGTAMQRVPRSGVSFEHTLYANTKALRKIGKKEYKKPPPTGMYLFGELMAGSKKARKIVVSFGSATTITYKWSGGQWMRSERGVPFVSEAGEPIGVDNLIIEEHIVNNSRRIVDVVGNPSIEIADPVGSGRALLFRDGRVIVGRWVREKLHKRVVYETRTGEEMVLAPGTTWVELLPNQKGEIKGRVTF